MTEFETIKDLLKWQAEVAGHLKDLRRADRQIGNWETKRAATIKALTDLGAPLPEARPFEEGVEPVTEITYTENTEQG